MGFTLTKDQENARKAFIDWKKKGNEQIFKLDGRAGTGKTTTAMYILQEYGLSNKEMMFVAYIGKAVLQMIRNGMNARTIHSAIYDYQTIKEYLPDGTYKYINKFVKRERLPKIIKFICIDEDSTVTDNMLEDLMSFGLPIFSMGDHNQLPPPYGKSSILPQPHAVLNEIMRQKKNDPIIVLANNILDNIPIRYGVYGPKCIVAPKDIMKYKSLYNKFNIVICGKNRTRDTLNSIIRNNVYGLSGDMPQIGDKIVCRKNNRDEMVNDIPLVNGSVGTVRHVYQETFNGRSVNIDFQPEFMEDDYYSGISMDYDYFNMSYEDRTNFNKFFSEGNLFELGYAITCHISQGSQYDSVLVYEERLGDNEYHKRWAYTAVTRAMNTLVYVK